MKTSVIRHRVADFLKRYSPFDALSEHDLLELAGSGRVKFHESEEYLFRQGDTKGQLIWVIQQGRVELLDESTSGGQLRDVIGEGDLLGLDRFVGDGSCLYSARTTTDVILYGVGAVRFEPLVNFYPAVKRFLSAQFSLSGAMGFGRSSWLDAEAPSADFLRARLVVVPEQASFAEAASRLSAARNGVAAIVDDCNRCSGILTPAELCAAGIEAGGPLATSQPVTVAAPLTTRVAVREMLRGRTEQLAITADGTSDGRLEAILTASELALFCGHNPARLVREIRHAASAAELAPLLRQIKRLVLDAMAQPLDVDDCCHIGNELMAALADACVRLAGAEVTAAGVDPPGAPYCWVLFGGSARGDLLNPELPTIASVYDDCSPDFKPDDSMYFAAVAGETLGFFHACGLDGPGLYWPAGSQPCMPLSEWKRLYSETIRDPLGHDLYARREFCDCRSLSGDVSILQKLQDHVLAELQDHETMIPLLARDTLAHLPPLTFFGGLVLELDGSQRESFDIAATAVKPVADAARVLSIARRHMAPANTLGRLQIAIDDFPDGATILRDAADAFRIGLYYQGLAGNSRIDAGKLGRVDQLLLKTAFSSIQRLLEFTNSAVLSLV